MKKICALSIGFCLLLTACQENVKDSKSKKNDGGDAQEQTVSCEADQVVQRSIDPSVVFSGPQAVFGLGTGVYSEGTSAAVCVVGHEMKFQFKRKESQVLYRLRAYMRGVTPTLQADMLILQQQNNLENEKSNLKRALTGREQFDDVCGDRYVMQAYKGFVHSRRWTVQAADLKKIQSFEMKETECSPAEAFEAAVNGALLKTKAESFSEEIIGTSVAYSVRGVSAEKEAELFKSFVASLPRSEITIDYRAQEYSPNLIQKIISKDGP